MIVNIPAKLAPSSIFKMNGMTFQVVEQRMAFRDGNRVLRTTVLKPIKKS